MQMIGGAGCSKKSIQGNTFYIIANPNSDSWPCNSLPRFLRAQEVFRVQLNTMNFKWCDCGYNGHIGFPCAHIF